jgi:ferritin-like metal-binding protein YciE|tara:strand:- start:1520 stop:1681 length:162 start_codon:yes stop_codon:yes gene_type:complete
MDDPNIFKRIEERIEELEARIDELEEILEVNTQDEDDQEWDEDEWDEEKQETI